MQYFSALAGRVSVTVRVHTDVSLSRITVSIEIHDFAIEGNLKGLTVYSPYERAHLFFSVTLVSGRP